VREVVLEVWTKGSGWDPVGGVSEAEPPGSFSSDEPEGRQVYVFGWLEGDGPGVWVSTLGVDAETPAFRTITSLGMEKLADLTDLPYLRPWRHGGIDARVRLRCVP
jgi:hypothetical protein